jgi:hypothetical protein
MSNRPKPPGSIDFELTDIEEARRILELPPEGLTAAQESAPDYWTLRRRAPLPSDRALTGPTMDWMMKLPAAVRPLKLSERFPRIANTIAQTWDNPEHCASLLAGLITDRRGRRRGFPVEVQREIEQLGAYRADGA